MDISTQQKMNVLVDCAADFANVAISNLLSDGARQGLIVGLQNGGVLELKIRLANHGEQLSLDMVKLDGQRIGIAYMPMPNPSTAN